MSSVSISEWQYGSTYGFHAMQTTGTNTTFSSSVPTTVTGGTLGVYYNGLSGAGGMTSFWYNTGSGWTLLTQNAPNFSATPYIGIVGQDYYGQSLSFNVSNLTVNGTAPVPLPPSIWLLGSGMIGLAGLRRKFKK